MALLLVLDRRYQLRRGRLFACYVLAYTAGRAWIEALRIDHANHFLGLRLNDWVSAILFAGAVVYLLATRGSDADGSPSGPTASAGSGSGAGSVAERSEERDGDSAEAVADGDGPRPDPATAEDPAREAGAGVGRDDSGRR
jgi:hypothetical protein